MADPREYRPRRPDAAPDVGSPPDGGKPGEETPVRHGGDRREFDRGPEARGRPVGEPAPPQLVELLAAQAFAPAADTAPSDEPEDARTAPDAADGRTDRPHAPEGPRASEAGRAQTPGPHVDRRRAFWIGGLVLTLLIVLLLFGILPHRARARTLEQRARLAALADSVPLVGAERVSRGAAGADLMLPGTLQSNHVAPIYARSTGYVRRWYVDIGSRVHAGDLLATIEAPDLDEELAQARQQAANARATLQLNAVTLQRWRILYRDSTVTKQELDTYQSNYDASVANVAAADANVRRVGALVGFERILAPFDGVITARNVDNGVFVTAAGTTNSPQPAGVGGNTIIGINSTTQLFQIASTDTIRVYLGVPQAYAPDVRVGAPVLLAIREIPGRTFAGRIARTAAAVDASSLTLLTEVTVINSDRSLLPGMYAEAHLRFERGNPPILMPGTALIFRTSAPQAAVIGSDSAVHFHNLTIGRDFGTVIEVDSGLADGDYVVAQPSDDLRDGQHVHVRVETQNGAPGGDTRAGAPVTAPVPANQSTGRPRGGQKARGGPPPPGAGGQPERSQPGSSTDKRSPQLEEGFPTARPNG